MVYALALCFLATSCFELLWQNVGVSAGVGNQQLEGQIINLSSIAFGLSSARHWKVGRSFLSALAAYLALWLLWLSFGYPQIFDAGTVHALQGFVFNVVLKVTTYILVGLLLIRSGPAGEQDAFNRSHPRPTEEIGPQAV
ncbi:MAG: hypothetical protein ACYDFT_07370 [Thermoplasmata archaeon]